mgnify:CR=1 FL=1
MRRKICTGVVGLGLFVSAGLAAPRPLDIYLNTIQLDAHTDKRAEDEFLQVGRDKPLGQTFRTGPKVEKSTESRSGRRSGTKAGIRTKCW